MPLKIDHRNSFISAINEGINLFVGSGFSTMAKDTQGRKLPTGGELAGELAIHFKITRRELSYMATILNNRKNKEFHDYLTERFTIGEFDPLYHNLKVVNINSVFTTNIDNLIAKIVETFDDKYLNDQRHEGASHDRRAINYIPLHGNVDSPEGRYIFTSAEIANIHQNSQRLFNILSQSVEQTPTLFIGYSMNDASTLQAIFSERNTLEEAHKEKWILVKDCTKEDREFFEALGLTIIEGELRELLLELPQLTVSKGSSLKGVKHLRELFKGNLIPSKTDAIGVRPIIHFFRGMSPTWSDILSSNIHPTHHVTDISNSILDTKRHTIVIGTPLCGKSTATMMATVETNIGLPKFIFNDLTKTKAEYIIKLIGKDQAIILIDNFTDDVEAFKLLSGAENIKLVAMDNSNNFSVVSHMFDTSKFDIINVTEVTDADFSGVYDRLPVDVRRKRLIHKGENNLYRRDTIFEFVIQNIKGQSIQDRYTEIIKNSDEDQVKFLTLLAYMHYCRVPLSIEVAASFFDGVMTYNDVFSLASELKDLTKEIDLEDLENTDYFYPRSTYVADCILRSVPDHILREIITGLHYSVPQVQIPRFNVFKRSSVDHKLIGRIFHRWEEGKNFYVKAYKYYNESAFVLQQGALYLSDKKQYSEAFRWIDRAKTQSNDQYFSIRNSHAIILFKANENVTEITPEVETAIEESMNILSQCYAADKRKDFHALIYTRQAIDSYKMINREKSLTFISHAQQWLKEESARSPWSRDVKIKLQQLNDFISQLPPEERERITQMRS